MQEINTFGQLEGENLAEAWDRFHELLRKCPHYRLTRWMQVHTFYNGLRNTTRTVIDTSAGGSLMKKTTDQAYEILEDAATNTNQWPREKVTPVKAVGGMDNEVLNNLDSKEPRMPYRPTHGSCVNSMEDSTVAQNVSQETLQ